MTGAWSPPPTTLTPYPRVDAFLHGGAVVYAGFGSMAAGDPVARARVVLAAARDAGPRTLVATGWGGLDVPEDVLGDGVLVTSAVDHSRS